MSALAIMLEAGFNFSVRGKDLLVSPVSKLSNEQRQFIKQHKLEIINELKSEVSVTCYTPSGNPMPAESRTAVVKVTDFSNDELPKFNSENRAAVLGWLHYIGENSQPFIDETLTRCESDPETLAYFLMRSKEVLRGS